MAVNKQNLVYYDRVGESWSIVFAGSYSCHYDIYFVSINSVSAMIDINNLFLIFTYISK